MKLLLPDACVLINIAHVFVGTHHITNVLNKAFDVETATEVFGEIKRQSNKVMPYEKEILHFANVAQKRFHRQEDYNNVLFNTFAPAGNPHKNAGERALCALALYRLRKRLASSIIILTDDTKAVNGLLKWFKEHFVGVDMWSSLDLILYLYMNTFPKWPFAQAQSAMRLVNSRIGGQQQEMMRRLGYYNKRLHGAHAILQSLPKVKVGALI